MDRTTSLQALENADSWDIIVIGGGATGLGVAVDAASRGYKTLLLEQADFAKGTSSRSTKLVHGGVRYLEQGNVRLVREALFERGHILKNAPHLAKKQAFIIPVYSLWESIKYTAGLKIYDLMAGGQRIGRSVFLSKRKVLESMPGVRTLKLRGGVRYYDGQFDDARMAVNLAQSCEDHGGTVLNYFKVTGLMKDEKGKLSGVVAKDSETGRAYQLKASVVVNATGVFVDEIHQMDEGEARPTIQPSQGIHLVLPPVFLETTTSALMIPKTDDGRVLFMVPWHGKLLAGTTDTPVQQHTLEPRALEEEITFILRNAGKYLKKAPRRSDVLSIFAGLRPLALPDSSKNGKSTKDISRNHSLQVSGSGLLTITGGKWTTYRRMAQDTVDKAITLGGLTPVACQTADMKIHGWSEKKEADDRWTMYGSDAPKIRALLTEHPDWSGAIDRVWDITRAEIVWSVRSEMARTVEDVLSRRFRVLFLDAAAAIRMAAPVARILSEELQRDEAWERAQVSDFSRLAAEYLLQDNAGPVPGSREKVGKELNEKTNLN
jgi:glycerol-3-phosphate dehydrogenase